METHHVHEKMTHHVHHHSNVLFGLNLMVFICSLVGAEDQESAICTQDLSVAYYIKWPATSTCTISDPPCLNERREFQLRCCSNGFWDREPRCAYVQQPIPNCPSDFKFDSNSQLCYTYTKKTKFPPKCPFEDVVPFNLYRDLVDSKQFGPVWIPVKRDLSNGLGFLNWVEPSSFYKTNFEENYYAHGSILGKNCLLFYNNSYIEAVSCDEEHFGVCAYAQLDKVRNNLCQYDDLCRQSDFSARSKCFCVGSTASDSFDFKLVEFVKPYQNFLYASLTNDECLIGLEKTSNGMYVWASTQTEINYTNWSPYVTFDDGDIYGVATTSGWTLSSDDNIPCLLYERDINDTSSAKLKLFYKHDSDLFTLKVTNPLGLKWLEVDSDPLLYCFTEATPYNLIYRYPKLTLTEQTDDTMIFEFNPSAHGPGNYWCESFRYPDLDVIRSNTIFLRLPQFDFEYVAILKVAYIPGTNPLSKQIIEFLERILFLHLGQVEHLNSFYTSRIMKILEVDEQANEIAVNVHFTSKGQHTEKPEYLNEYHFVKDIIRAALSFIEVINIEMISFRSPDFCVAEQTNMSDVVLTWPHVNLSESATPKEFCFRPDTTIISRRCDGNFFDGAYWSQIEDSCQMPEYSPVTSDLIDILESDWDSNCIIETVINITLQHHDFKPVDIYLLGRILQKLRHQSGVNLTGLSKIISNLHKVENGVLKESQAKMNATDEILYHLDELILNSEDFQNEDHVEISSDNFMIVISNLAVSNMTGLVVQNDNDSLCPTILYDDVTLEDLRDYANVESAILLTPELKIEIMDKTKLVITLFYSDALFNENSRTSNFVSKVFGVLLPNIESTLVHPISILHKVERANGSENCAFWNYGTLNESANIQGFWNKDNFGIDFMPTLTLCQFWHVTHFALLLMSDSSRLSQIDMSLLDWITTINCSLSLVGLVGILMTGILFKRWRSNTGNQILINFVLAISLHIATFYISNMVFKDINNDTLCTITGLVLHFAIVSQFCWMFIIAILQFKRFVEVLGGPPKYVLLKACFCGWILPLLPVLCVILLDDTNYTSGHVGLCYPSGLGLYLGVWLPISIIVVINFVIFIYIIYNVVHRKTECVDTVNDETLFQWRLAILLFFMLGLTWSFGLLSEFDFGIVFIYLFTITATLQGFIMFLFFIVFNKNTRYLYCHSVKMYCVTRKRY